MYQKILVPLDGSDFSERSLTHVTAISRGCNVPEIILFGVVEPVPQAGEAVNFIGTDWSVQAEKQALEWLKGYMATTAEKLSKEGFTTKTVVAHGPAAEEILDYVAKNKIDLVIMTTHGRSGIARWAMGSVAEKVIRHSGAPVLIIPPPGGKARK